MTLNFIHFLHNCKILLTQQYQRQIAHYYITTKIKNQKLFFLNNP